MKAIGKSSFLKIFIVRKYTFFTSNFYLEMIIRYFVKLNLLTNENQRHSSNP
ncbi:MAG: hypothetical protein ACI9FW_002248 [Flavobacterium sp.]